MSLPLSMNPTSMYDFDARMSSKISVMDEVLNPIFEKDPYLELALRDVAHPTLSDAISTLSEPSDFPLMLPPSVASGKQGTGKPFEQSLPELLHNPTDFSFDVYDSYSQNLGERVGSQAVGENLMRHNLTTTNPLSGDYTTDSFSLMSNPEHDLYGFLSQAVPLTQMTSAVSEINAQAPIQPLSTMPCILPLDRTPIPQAMPSMPDIQPNCLSDSFRQIYSTTAGCDAADPMVSVVKPVISKEAAAQTSLATVSLAMSRGSPTVTSQSPRSKRSVASVTEIGLAGNNKRTVSRLFECPICHKMFERAYNRKMHLTTHEAIENRLKPFVCPLESCGKRFARKHDKNRHYLGVHLRARKSAPKAETDMNTAVSDTQAPNTILPAQPGQTNWGNIPPLQERQPVVWPT